MGAWGRGTQWLERHRVVVDGVHLHARLSDGGANACPAVVMVRGFGVASRYWRCWSVLPP